MRSVSGMRTYRRDCETISSRTATSARRGRGRSRFPSCKPGACEWNRSSWNLV